MIANVSHAGQQGDVLFRSAGGATPTIDCVYLCPHFCRIGVSSDTFNLDPRPCTSTPIFNVSLLHSGQPHSHAGLFTCRFHVLAHLQQRSRRTRYVFNLVLRSFLPHDWEVPRLGRPRPILAWSYCKPRCIAAKL